MEARAVEDARRPLHASTKLPFVSLSLVHSHPLLLTDFKPGSSSAGVACMMPGLCGLVGDPWGSAGPPSL